MVGSRVVGYRVVRGQGGDAYDVIMTSCLN